MKVYDLSPAAVSRMTRVDLATADRIPDSLIEPFSFHGCECLVASFVGRPPWELHKGGDELIHVLAGETELTVFSEGQEESRLLREGDMVVVPHGCWHRNSAPTGVTVLAMTPREGTENSWDDPRQRP